MKPPIKEKSESKLKTYIKNLLVAIDQLGNALAGGNPDVTISARTGYFAKKSTSGLRCWWRCMEAVINFAFYPIDGPDHCYNAYLNDNESKHNEGNDFLRALLGVFIIVCCLFISVFTRLLVLLLPSQRYAS